MSCEAKQVGSECGSEVNVKPFGPKWLVGLQKSRFPRRVLRKTFACASSFAKAQNLNNLQHRNTGIALEAHDGASGDEARQEAAVKVRTRLGG